MNRHFIFWKTVSHKRGMVVSVVGVAWIQGEAKMVKISDLFFLV